MSVRFDAVLLPDEAKRALCEALLDEFAARYRVNERTGEMVHGCLVSPGLHSDQDKNPTASLNYRKLTYKCLGCGSSGGLLWFIARCRGGSTGDARKWLEGETGLGTEVMELDQLLNYLDQLYNRRDEQPIPTYSLKLLDGWAYDHPYLPEQRGISQENLLRARVGWDPESDRITLPHIWKGELVGWQTRKLPEEYWSKVPEKGSPKYLSSPDFPKDATVYDYRPEQGRGYPVESMLSSIRHRHKIHMPATFGATITETQLKLLAKYEWLGFWLDNDKAGWTALEGRRAAKATKERPAQDEKAGVLQWLAEYTEVWVVPSPWQQDAGDLPTEEVLALAAQAVPWTLWKRPEVLYCFTCRNRAHDGPCRT